jgi:hypothetical protein
MLVLVMQMCNVYVFAVCLRVCESKLFKMIAGAGAHQHYK